MAEKPWIPKLRTPIEQMIREIAHTRSLRIEQWMDQWGHWRVGIDWYSENEYAYIVERAKLEDALEDAYEWFKELSTECIDKD